MTELGNILKEAREAKGLSLDELQSITKIQKRYLLGIEEGNYSMMPGKFYVRAFIKQYADAVGLEPDPLFEQYKSEIPSTYNEELPEQLSRVRSKKGFSADTTKAFDILPKILIAIFVISVIALAWYWIVLNVGDDSKDPDVTKKDAPSVEEPTNKATDGSDDITDGDQEQSSEEEEQPAEELPAQELNVVSTSGRNSVYELKQTDQFVLKIVSLGETWVGVKDSSGKTVFGETLVKGKNESKTEDLSNESQAVIKIGFTPDTEIYVNDQKLEYAIPTDKADTQQVTINFVKE